MSRSLFRFAHTITKLAAEMVVPGSREAARGLPSTRVQARADAIEAAASYVKSLEDFPPVPEDVLE